MVRSGPGAEGIGGASTPSMGLHTSLLLASGIVTVHRGLGSAEATGISPSEALATENLATLAFCRMKLVERPFLLSYTASKTPSLNLLQDSAM